MPAASAEEVALGFHHELAGAAVAGHRQAPDDDDGDAVGLPAYQAGGRRDLVGDRDLRRAESRPLQSVVFRRSRSGSIPATPIATSVVP